MPDSQHSSPQISPLVLLIEDNAVNRYTVARMLRQAGFAVAEAESGAQAMQTLHESPVDVVVCDVELPDVNGFELCRRLKADPQTASIPFLQMSASFTSSQDQVQGLEGGADGYLVHPFEIPVLAATIRAALRVRVAEEQARSLSRQWQTTFTSIRDAIVVTDMQGRITRYNAAFGALFGDSPHLAENQSVFALGENCLQFSPEFLVESSQPPAEVQIGDRWFRVQRDLLRDDQGIASGVIQILSDSTTQKHAEEEQKRLIGFLEFERARLEAIFKSVPAAVSIMRGPEHHFELVNPAFEKLVGAREVLGKTPLEAFPEIESQGFYEPMSRVYENGEEFVSHETPLLLKSESGEPMEERFVDLLYQPLREADGSISGVFSHIIDISEQVRARKEAETANRLKDEFLATLSHELRTPLTSILGWAEILIDGGLDEATSSRALQSILRNAQAQNQLVEDILDVSRIMSGKLNLTTHEFDLAISIESSINVVRPAASAKGIRLSIDLEPNVGLILGDANRLQQVMWNLLSNAIKFTPQGGRVSISLERVGAYAQVTVGDTGQGIAPEFLPHVFDRFRQADSSSTRPHSGLGLGLAIVRQLVELHGGTVRAESAGKGQGAQFVARFPLIATIAPPQVEMSELRNGAEDDLLGGASFSSEMPVSIRARGELAGVRVLVVDDEPDARTLVGVVLERAGAVVSLAASVAEAWSYLEREPRPQMLVSDLGMPGEDGYSLIRRLRHSEVERQMSPLPAVALTAFARAEDRSRVLSEGFDAYQSKPLEALKFIALVSHLVQRGS